MGIGEAAVGVRADCIAGGERDRQFGPAGPEKHLLPQWRPGGTTTVHASADEDLLRCFDQVTAALLGCGQQGPRASCTGPGE